MNYIEIIAFIFSLMSVIGLANRKMYGWYSGLIGVSAFFYLFYQEKLYMDMVLQVIFFVQSLIGIYNWKIKTDDVKLSTISWDRFILHLSTTVAIGIIIGMILSEYTNASQPYLDSILSVVCLLANYYLTKKILQSWIVWISVDVFYLFLFYNQEMYITLLLYVLFLGNSIRGLIKWRKDITLQTYLQRSK